MYTNQRFRLAGKAGLCLFLAWAVWAQGKICRMETIVQDLVAFEPKDTVHCPKQKNGGIIRVDSEVSLLGPKFAICPDLIKPKESKINVIFCVDRSGSMVGPGGTDPDTLVKKIAQAFVDSLAVRSPNSKVAFVFFGMSRLWPRGSGADSMFIRAGDDGNRRQLESYLQSGLTFGAPTAYAEALDTAMHMFKTLGPIDTNNAIIFLSDGKPQGSDFYGNDNVAAYEAFKSSGRIKTLPPTYTVYFHTVATADQEAKALLAHLSTATGGTGYDAADPAILQGVFSDSIMATIVPTNVPLSIGATDYYFENLSTGNGTWAHVHNEGLFRSLLTMASPLPLRDGYNQIKLSCVRVKSDSTNAQAYRRWTVIRKPGSLTAIEETDFKMFFAKRCLEAASQSTFHGVGAISAKTHVGTEEVAGKVTFSVCLSRPGPFSITLFDVFGRSIWSHQSKMTAQGLHKIRLGKVRLPNGAYFARGIVDGRQWIRKIALIK